MTYDIETFMLELKAFLIETLNASIAAIGVEKGDGLTLKPIDASAYVFQSLEGYNANWDPFVFIGISDVPQSVSKGPQTATTYTIDIAILVNHDQSSDSDTDLKKTLRYHRALQDVFHRQWGKTKFGNSNNIKIQNMAPIAVQFGNNTVQRAVGISIQPTLVTA